MEISGKKISIIGAVKSGIGAAKLIRTLGGLPFISDSGTEEKLKDSISVLKEYKIEFEIGNHSDRVFDCELMIVSPGVPLTADLLVKAREKGIDLISEIELAAAFCKGNIIAITGSTERQQLRHCTIYIKYAGLKSYPEAILGSLFPR